MASFNTKYTDPKNRPHIVKLYAANNITEVVQLPVDVQIIVDGEKIIAESKILDGVSVFERIGRKPFRVDFDFTIRQLENGYVEYKKGEFSKTVKSVFQEQTYKFPQDSTEEMIVKAWNPNQIIKVENTYLNGIGIGELVVKNVTFQTMRGSVNVVGHLKTLENHSDPDGGTLIVT